jgi:phosphopentomutase
MDKYKRIFVIVLDSLGIGAMPDAADFGDEGADTLGHILEKMGKINIPNLSKLGFLNLHTAGKMKGVEKPLGRYMRLSEASNGKDTMTGHWEMMGLKTAKPFKTFTDTGFPPELIAELEKRCGKRVIGNRSESGTKIIEELGEEEINTGAMIVYTSADSVLQICGNEETFDLQNLYRCCEIAREITMKDQWRVGRVIARPYVGKKKGEFKRTANRHDYALKPGGATALNALSEAGFDVYGVGKINDIFCGEGITKTWHSESSVHGMEQTISICEEDFNGLCFVNLVDFDARWGHRRDVSGYASEIEKFDKNLGVLLTKLRDDDLVIITADHGNDPTYSGTDHTREYVPFLAYSNRMKEGGKLENKDTFAVIGATVCDNFGVKMPEGTIGTSVLDKLL